MSHENFRIAALYEFRRMTGLVELRLRVRQALLKHDVKGTIILAEEGYNATVSGTGDSLEEFIRELGVILGTTIEPKYSEHHTSPFRRAEVKIKNEIVTLRHPVAFEKGAGNAVEPQDWNALISRPDVILLDARNDYEYRCGTFPAAVNPLTEKFSELPAFVSENFDKGDDRAIAMFCTGGIRCEKFAPYLIEQGFDRIYHLKGGILKYLEEVAPADQLWQGECFVFDERISVDQELKKGRSPDLSQDLLSRHEPVKIEA